MLRREPLCSPFHLLRTYCTWGLRLRHATDGLAPYKLRLVLLYITDHLAQQVRPGNLAALVQMALYHFLQAFRQSLEVPPRQYILAHRMEQA
ncbi:MAG TPA: hypothetical protein VLQ80_21010 [Candidatus Saccharimonadia bacterium]|nr:hypothetical protein [Candidatus Saccharimonadia bacterium]